VDGGDGGVGGRVARSSPSYDYVYCSPLKWLATSVYPQVRGVVAS